MSEIFIIGLLSLFQGIFVVVRGKNKRKWVVVSIIATIVLGLYIGYTNFNGTWISIAVGLGVALVIFLFLLFIDFTKIDEIALLQKAIGSKHHDKKVEDE